MFGPLGLFQFEGLGRQFWVPGLLGSSVSPGMVTPLWGLGFSRCTDNSI